MPFILLCFADDQDGLLTDRAGRVRARGVAVDDLDPGAIDGDGEFGERFGAAGGEEEGEGGGGGQGCGDGDGVQAYHHLIMPQFGFAVKSRPAARQFTDVRLRDDGS